MGIMITVFCSHELLECSASFSVYNYKSGMNVNIHVHVHCSIRVTCVFLVYSFGNLYDQNVAFSNLKIC